MSACSSTEVGSSSRITRCALGALLERQRLGELDHLAGGEVEIGGGRRRVDVDLDLLQLAARGGVERAPAHQPALREGALAAEIDVLADGEVGQQRLLLKHHADAVRGGIARALQRGALRRAAPGCRHRAGRRRPGCASASTCRRRSRRPAPPPRAAGPRSRRPAGPARPGRIFRRAAAPARGRSWRGHLTILRRARSTESATAMMIMMPWTICWT